MKLLLEEVTDENRIHIATLEGRSQVIGRDLTADIPVARDSLSRHHGIFLCFPSGWAYRDQGSTNGSWINQDKLNPMQLKVLQDGDYLQLADMLIKVRYQSEDEQTVEGFRLFTVGAESETIELDPKKYDGTIVTQGGFLFELRDGSLFLDTDESEAEVLVNGQPVTGSNKLTAGDSVESGGLTFIVVFGLLAKRSLTPKAILLPEKVAVRHDLTDVPAGSKGSLVEGDGIATVFSSSQTTMVDPKRLGGIRFGEYAEEEDDHAPVVKRVRSRDTSEETYSFFDLDRFSEAEKRLLIGILFFLGSTIILILVWLLVLR